MPLASGARLGPFEILEPLGAGGMGEVYRARDSRLGRIVAVKVLRPDVAADPDRIERFEREARAASALNHPNIVTIHDVGVAEGTSYIAMEWVDGSPLRDLVARGKAASHSDGRQPRRADRGRARQGACRGHRPSRPQTRQRHGDRRRPGQDSRLRPGEAGGGAATRRCRSWPRTSGGTAAGILLGTVGYMSPEQATGREVDHRSDQFALGVILYELATGVRAFKRDSARANARGHHRGRARAARGPQPASPAAAVPGDRALPVEEAGRPLRVHAGSRARPQRSRSRELSVPCRSRAGSAIDWKGRGRLRRLSFWLAPLPALVVDRSVRAGQTRRGRGAARGGRVAVSGSHRRCLTGRISRRG